jgi:HD-like signal output (HDOD) protein
MTEHPDISPGSALNADALDASLEASLRDIGIPPRPVILEQIMLETRKDEPDFKRIAVLIGRDVSLSAGFLKTANSPYYGLRQKVHNVREALLVLGLRTAAHTLAGLIMRQVLPAGPHLERFWDASDRTAQLSGWLVQKLGVRFGVQSEDAYTFGLFRDCGIPILMRKYQGYYHVLADANRDAGQRFTDVEEATLPTNHALVGSLMAQSWWLPEANTLAIRHHHDHPAVSPYATQLPGASRRLIALAQLAEKLQQDETGLNLTREWDKLGTACLAWLDLAESDLEELKAESETFLAQASSL